MRKINLWDQPSDIVRKFASNVIRRATGLSDEDMLTIQTLRIIFDAAPRNLFSVHTLRNALDRNSMRQLCVLSINNQYAFDSRIFAEVITPMSLRYHQFRKKVPQTKSYFTCRNEVINYTTWRIHIPSIEVHATIGDDFQLVIGLPKYQSNKQVIYESLIERFIRNWGYSTKEIPFNRLIKDLLWLAENYGFGTGTHKHPIKSTTPWTLHKKSKEKKYNQGRYYVTGKKCKVVLNKW